MLYLQFITDNIGCTRIAFMSCLVLSPRLVPVNHASAAPMYATREHGFFSLVHNTAMPTIHSEESSIPYVKQDLARMQGVILTWLVTRLQPKHSLGSLLVLVLRPTLYNPRSFYSTIPPAARGSAYRLCLSPDHVLLLLLVLDTLNMRSHLESAVLIFV